MPIPPGAVGGGVRSLPTSGFCSEDGQVKPLAVDSEGKVKIAGNITADLAGDEADLDLGPGEDLHEVVAIGLPANGGHVVGGTVTHPLNVVDLQIADKFPVPRGNLFRVVANNEAVPADGMIGPSDADYCEHYPYWGVSVYSTQAGTLLIEYSLNGTTWRTLANINISADTPFDQVYRVTRQYYRVSFTNTSASTAYVDIVTVRSTG